MRKLCGVLAVAAMLLVGGSAQAAPVVTTGTISVDLGVLGSFSITGVGTVSIVGTGSISTSTGGITGSQILVPSGIVNLATTITITVPATQSTLVDSVILNPGLGIGGNGTFVSGFAPVAGETCPQGAGNACVVGGGKGGVLPLGGVITAVLAGGIMAPVNLGALNIGTGGAGSAGLISGEGAPWTTGQGQVVTANGTAVSTGDMNEPITFVTPTYVNALGSELPVFTTLSFSGIKMVPEPGTLLLLGAGVAGLALVGRRRN